MTTMTETEKDYDLFERMRDGSFRWVGVARGLTAANRRLDQLARASGTDCVAYDRQTDRIIGKRGSAVETFTNGADLLKSESKRSHAAKHCLRADRDSAEAPSSRGVGAAAPRVVVLIDFGPTLGILERPAQPAADQRPVPIDQAGAFLKRGARKPQTARRQTDPGVGRLAALEEFLTLGDVLASALRHPVANVGRQIP